MRIESCWSGEPATQGLAYSSQSIGSSVSWADVICLEGSPCIALLKVFLGDSTELSGETVLSKKHWGTLKGSERMSTGIRSPVSGRGVEVLIRGLGDHGTWPLAAALDQGIEESW